MLIVPESERLTAIPQALGAAPVISFPWFGDNPQKGMTVLSYGDYSVRVHPSYDCRHQWIVPLNVSGPTSFLLLAVWTLPYEGSRSYVRHLSEAFDRYQPLFETSEAIWAGDFNASFALDRPAYSHKFCDFVRLLDAHGFRSLYHEQHGCQHGDEPDDTFFLHHHRERGFHIDFMFASSGFLSSKFSVSIGAHAAWARQSDHMPLTCDFHEQPRTSPI